MIDRYAVICNQLTATSIAPAGAKAWLTHVSDIGNGYERPVVLVTSRGGRLVERRMASARLDNFRVTTVPPEHPRYDDERVCHETRQQAQALADALAQR